MNNNTISDEINRILNEVKELFLLEDNRSISILDVASDENQLSNRHIYLQEMNKLFDIGQNFDFKHIFSLEKTFEQLKIQSPISIEEILEIASLLEMTSKIKDLFNDEKEYPFFFEESYLLNPLSSYVKDIHFIISDDMKVSDNASVNLKNIREEIRTISFKLRNMMNDLKNKYSSYLSEKIIVYKDGYELLPVKKEYKSYIKGSVYSSSNSEETLFMIPYEVLDLKNKLSNLQSDEKEEIFKIISSLSLRLSKQLDIITRDYKIALLFDRYFAFTTYGRSHSYQIADTTDDEFIMRDFYHPLLDEKIAVKNTIDLSKNRCLVISGPNAGGKSVLIKAVAINVLLDKLGMMVSSSLMKTPYIDDVFFLGGDEQSIVNNLSTFQSHLLSIKNICDKCTAKSLVIIDEICQGTSPEDGEALAISILKYFLSINCYCIISSHYEGLKFFAKNENNINCSSMEFSLDDLKPTYHLLSDSISPSYGIELAKNTPLDTKIIEDATDYRKEHTNAQLLSLVNKLASKEKEIEKEKELLHEKEMQLNALIKKREDAIIALKEEKENIANKANKKIEKIVDEKIEEIDKIYKDNNIKLSFDNVSKIKGNLKKIKNDKPSDEKIQNNKISTLVKGDYVKDESNSLYEVLEVNKNKVTLSLNGLKITRPILGLTKANKPFEKPKEKISSADFKIQSGSSSYKLNVIGLYVDECLREVKTFIDRGVTNRYPMLVIIHGQGSFKLKNAIWNYLSKLDYIKSYRLGNEYEGGFGVTIINL